MAVYEVLNAQDEVVNRVESSERFMIDSGVSYRLAAEQPAATSLGTVITLRAFYGRVTKDHWKLIEAEAETNLDVRFFIQYAKADRTVDMASPMTAAGLALCESEVAGLGVGWADSILSQPVTSSEAA